MNKTELFRKVSAYLKDEGIRKPVRLPKKVFHISDDEGNSKDFVTQITDKTVAYTADDVENIINAFIQTIFEALRNGETVTIRQFGSFVLRYHKPRMAISPHDGTEIMVGGEYYPRFLPAKDMKIASRLYGQLLKARGINPDPSFRDNEEGDEDNGS